MARKQVDGTNPLPDGQIGSPDNATRPDNKKYRPFEVESTGHGFYAPYDKYKDVMGVLGLKELDSNNDGTADTEKSDTQITLPTLPGSNNPQDTRNDTKIGRNGLYYLKVRVAVGNGSLMLICDPEKFSVALQELKGKKVYGETIRKASPVRHRVFNG